MAKNFWVTPDAEPMMMCSVLFNFFSSALEQQDQHANKHIKNTKLAC